MILFILYLSNLPVSSLKNGEDSNELKTLNTNDVLSVEFVWV